jgi:hypothetical protein
MFSPVLWLLIQIKHCVEKIQQCMSSQGDFRNVKYRTIFHDLVDSSILPKEDKSAGRLWEEAQLLIAAGTITTATSISSAFVYLLLDPKRLQVLLEELETAIPIPSKPPRQAELEQLPYLVGRGDKSRKENEAHYLLDRCCSRNPSSGVGRFLSPCAFRPN